MSLSLVTSEGADPLTTNTSCGPYVLVWQFSSCVVTWGVYSITRNPMYLGLLMILTGWAIFLSNALALLFLPLFVLYINRFQIKPEERALTAIFGQDYLAYQGRVRRWI